MKIKIDIPDNWPVWAKSVTVCFTEGDKPYQYNDASRKEIAFIPRPTSKGLHRQTENGKYPCVDKGCAGWDNGFCADPCNCRDRAVSD